MKKQLLLLTLLCTQGFFVIAKQVDEPTAKNIAENFFARQAHVSAGDMSLAYKLTGEHQQNCLYVFSSDKGFVIVSADDNCMPVLGYSTESVFNTNNMSPELSYMLDFYKKEIGFIIDHGVKGSEKIINNWKILSKPSLQQLAKTSGIPVIAALVTTKWNQSPYYNVKCPYDSAQHRWTVTGCVATAMAQVMKFWNYPAQGTGSHSYIPGSNPQYGLLTANFGATTYQWSSMPNSVSNDNIAIGTLMFHAGVSVDMDYTPDFSGAWVISYNQQINDCSENALQQYFGYRHDINGVERRSYTTEEWIGMLKMELNASRPMIYVGYSSADGHAFVADGYDNNDFLHINWGWGGMYNGYFSVDAMDPSTAPGYNFDFFQEALTKIEPANPSVAIDLNATISAPATVYYKQAFSVAANLINHGAANFAGDYAAKVFDVNGNLVGDIEVMSTNTLAAGNQTGVLNFSTTGLANMTPGQYFIGIYYRPTGKTWYEARETGTYTNLIPINVQFATGIEETTKTPNISIYPNPANTTVTISMQNNKEVRNIRIMDVQGKEVLQTLAEGKSSITIPVQTLTSGLYFVQFISDEKVQTEKLLIKK